MQCQVSWLSHSPRQKSNLVSSPPFQQKKKTPHPQKRKQPLLVVSSGCLGSQVTVVFRLRTAPAAATRHRAAPEVAARPWLPELRDSVPRRRRCCETGAWRCGEGSWSQGQHAFFQRLEVWSSCHLRFPDCNFKAVKWDAPSETVAILKTVFVNFW